MEINFKKMGNWEVKKACYLLTIASDLDMDLSGYGELAVNPNSGYTYLWLEDYLFTLYMPINCELKKYDVWVMWTNYENGEEHETTLGDMTLNDIWEWVRELEKTNIGGTNR